MADKTIVIDFEFTTSHSLEAIEQTKKAILDLKTQKAILSSQNKQETKEYALLEAQLANLNKTLREQQKELQNDLKAMEANDGSLKSMRLQLNSLVGAYDKLTESERNSSSGQALSAKIQSLTKDIKVLEEETERYGRNVGNYAGSIRQALTQGMDTAPLKQQLRELTMELQNLTLQQRTLRDEMSQTSDPQALEEMEKKYNLISEAISQTTAKAGQLSDTIGDVSRSIRTSAEDFQVLKGIQEGIGLLADSYTILKSATVALGIENEKLMDIFAKLQIIQQGVNAMYRISNALQKEGAIRTNLIALKTKLMNTELMKLITAKRMDAKASATDAVATKGLATAQTGATVATKGLSTALKAVPVLGWIAAATGAILALIKIMRSVKKETEDISNAIEGVMDKSMMEKALMGAEEASRKTAVTLNLCAENALKAAAGSKEQEYWVRKVAEQTGLSYDYLLQHLDILPDIVKQYVKLAKAKLAFEKGLELQVDTENVAAELSQALKDIGALYDTNVNKWAKAAKKFADENVSDAVKSTKAWKDFAKSMDQGGEAFKSGFQYAKDQAEKMMQETVDKGQETLEKLGEDMEKEASEYEKIAAKAGKNVVNTNATVAKQVDTLWEKLYKKTLPELLKAYDKETEDALKRMPEHMKSIFEAQRLLGRENVIEKYMNDSATASVKLAKDLKGLYQIIGDIGGIRDLEMGFEFPWEKQELILQDRNTLESMMEGIVGIIASYTPEIQQALKSSMKISPEDMKEQIKNLTSPEDFREFISLLRSELMSIQDVLQSHSGEISQEMTRATNAQLDNMHTSLDMLDNIKYMASQTLPAIRQLTYAMYELTDQTKRGLQGLNEEANQKLIEAYNTLSGQDLELMVRVITDDASVRKAQLELDDLKAREDALKNLDVDVQLQMGSTYNEQLAAAHAAVVESEMNLAKKLSDIRGRDLKDAERVANEKKQAQVETYNTIGNAAASAFGNLAQIFSQMAEEDERYAAFSKAMAVAQVAVSTAMSIASAIQGATAAGAATGVAAPFTTPAFIAEMVAIVIGAVAQAVSILSNVQTPRFAFGGPIGGVGGPMTDNIPIMASPGEYMIRASAVNKYGKDYFDALNAGLITSEGTDIVGALREVIEDMPNPVVSVKEINNMQSRIRVKEQISRS